MTELIDSEGLETLNTIAGADRFNQWMFDTIRPFIKGRVLEVGSGIGNISHLLLNTGGSVVLSDYAASYTQLLRSRFSVHPNCSGVLDMNLEDPAFDEKFGRYYGTFDTVVALNVIEHIEQDGLAVAHCTKLLNRGGNLIVIVPAYQGLYNRFDKELGHFRRYTKKEMQRLVGEHLSIVQCRNFNLAGILGWFVSGTILKNKVIPSYQMDAYNTLVPFFKLMDRIVSHRIGLSVLIVGQKRENIA